MSAHRAGEPPSSTSTGPYNLAISLRNVGSGIAVCQGWAVRPGDKMRRENYPTHVPIDEFHIQ